jgi:hypothetical protein
MPTVVCPVCGTENDSSRIFCRKCASDLHATAVYQVGQAPPPPPPPSVPIRPIVIGGGLALLVIAVVIGVVLALGSGSPAPSPSPFAEPSIALPTSGPTLSPTHPPVTAPPITSVPTAAGPATPAPTPTDAPPIIRFFTGPTSVNCSDPSFTGTIHLSWRIGNADGASLSIDGPGVYMQYAGVLRDDNVPFACDGSSHTYILVTYGGIEPPAEKDLVIGPATP